MIEKTNSLETRIAVIENDIKNIKETITDVKILLNKMTDIFAQSHETLSLNVHELKTLENRITVVETSTRQNTKKLYWINGIIASVIFFTQYILPLVLKP